jgi:hypothetical protein
MFLEFFDRVEVANFEIASDAFATFKVGYRCRERTCAPVSRKTMLALCMSVQDLLTRHKAMVAVYLQEHYSEVCVAVLHAGLCYSSNVPRVPYLTRSLLALCCSSFPCTINSCSQATM